MGREKNAENIPFLRSTQPKSTERVPVVELSGSEAGRTLFAESFKKRKSTNDSDRLRKYLSGFGLSWKQVTETETETR